MKGRGNSKTPATLVKYIKMAIAEKGQTGFAKESGVSHTIISRYKSGIGEPTTATLKKFSDYFGIPVLELRSDAPVDENMTKTNSNITNIVEQAVSRERSRICKIIKKSFGKGIDALIDEINKSL